MGLLVPKSKSRSLRMLSVSTLSEDPKQMMKNLPSTAVRCDSAVESEEFRLIEIPYFCGIQIVGINVIDLPTRVEKFVLSALAEGMLACYDEEIRRSLTVKADQSSRVIAAYSSSSNLVSDQCEYARYFLILVALSLVLKTRYIMSFFALDACSISNTKICTTIEGMITLAVEGGSSSEDERIENDAFTTLRLAFRDFNDPDILSANYIGINTTLASLIDQYSEQGMLGSTEDDNTDSMIFLVFSITCSLFAGIVFFVIFLSFRNDDSGDEGNSMGDTCSVSVASSYDDSVSELGSDPPPPPNPLNPQRDGRYCVRGSR